MVIDYRLYRTGHIATVLRESRNQKKEKSPKMRRDRGLVEGGRTLESRARKENSGAYFSRLVGSLTEFGLFCNFCLVWIRLVLWPIALENKSIVQTLFKQQKLGKKTLGELRARNGASKI